MSEEDWDYFTHFLYAVMPSKLAPIPIKSRMLTLGSGIIDADSAKLSIATVGLLPDPVDREVELNLNHTLD